MWEHTDWNDNTAGDFVGRDEGKDNWTNLGPGMNDQMSSWANRSATYTSCGAGGFDGAGDRQTWSSLNSDNNVAPWNNDEVSSWRTKFGC